MEIVNLKKEDYDELHSLLNYVFGIKTTGQWILKKTFPKCAKKDDEYMGKYIAIKEDGKICAKIKKRRYIRFIEILLICNSRNGISYRAFKYNTIGMV